MKMKSLLLAVALIATPTIAAEMSADEAFAVVEETAEHCFLGKMYDGGPDLSAEETAAACAKYEEAKNRLAELGIKE